jgi:hypothetical protein
MLLLAATTDKLQLVTDVICDVDTYAAMMDYTTVVAPVAPQLATIVTATTTDIVAAPATSTTRNVKHLNIRNAHASIAVTVTVLFNRSATVYELFKARLSPGDTLEYQEGVGWFVVTTVEPPLIVFNQAVTSQALGTADVYLTGSFIVFPRAPKVGTRYNLQFDSVKTGAGTAAPIISLRFGTAGSLSDTARNTLTLGVQTGVIDTATFEVDLVIRTAGSSGVSQATVSLSHVLDSTGYSIGGASVQSTSSPFDLTVAGLGVGASFNGGALHAGTLQFLAAELING